MFDSLRSFLPVHGLLAGYIVRNAICVLNWYLLASVAAIVPLWHRHEVVKVETERITGVQYN